MGESRITRLERELLGVKDRLTRLETNLDRDEETMDELEKMEAEPECVAHVDEVTCYCRDCQTDRYVKAQKEESR